MVVLHTGTRIGEPDFDVRADVNGDGVIDVADGRAEARLLNQAATEKASP